MEMQTITTIGLDIAKSVFQVHGVDAAGNAIIRRELKRRYAVASGTFEKYERARSRSGSRRKPGKLNPRHFLFVREADLSRIPVSIPTSATDTI
jgi:hypothetical protein